MFSGESVRTKRLGQIKQKTKQGASAVPQSSEHDEINPRQRDDYAHCGQLSPERVSLTASLYNLKSRRLNTGPRGEYFRAECINCVSSWRASKRGMFS